MSDVEAKRALLRSLLVKRAAQPRRYPCSFAQERLWFLDRLVPGNPFYNVEAAIPIDSAIDPNVLERAVNEIVARHGALRTTFRDDGAGPVQVVAPHLHVPLQRIDLRALSREERGAAQVAIRRERARTAFDLENGPLILTDLLQLEAGRSLFLLNMHHIVADGWSMGVFSRELSVLYAAFLAGQPSPLPPLRVQYGDFAQWQRNYFKGEALTGELDFWRKQLEAIQPLELPTDRARPRLQSYQGDFHTAQLDEHLSRSVRQFCRTRGVTPFMTLLAAFKMLLFRYSGQQDVAVGTYIANRDREELESLIGFFLNTLVLRTRIDPARGFGALVSRVKETSLDAYAHQSLPFARLVQELAPQRDLSRNPLVQIVFQLQNATRSDAASASQALVDYQRGAAAFDIAVTCYESGGTFHATWEYSTDLFDAATIRQMASHFELQLAAAIAEPDRPLHELQLLDHEEVKRVLSLGRGRSVHLPQTSLVEMLLQQAAAVPDAVAFRDGQTGAKLTFSELASRSRALARVLHANGVEQGTACGVCLPRGLDLPVAMFGVWRARAIYVPLDPDYPRSRLLYMLQDCDATVVVGEPGSQIAAAIAATAQRKFIEVPREHADVDDGEVTFVQDPDAISHVIYTSGSTGRPKAAPSPHRQILNRLHWMWRDYPFEKGEVGCVKTATSFIDSLWELLGPLLQAVPSVMVPQQALMDPERTIRLLAQHDVSRLWLVPSYLRALLDADPDIGARLPRLRFWVASGEILPIELQRRFSVAHPAATLFNLYGTSEVWDATWHDPRLFKAEGATRVPIGRPIDNVLCVVLDPWGRLAPAGVTGELHVGGMAMGCSRQSARRRCIEVANHDSLEVWSCGDMVRWRHDGELEFIGRSDGELKIRGMRVEPAELESVLMEHSAVRSAALLAWPAPGGTLRLVAYVQPRDRLPAAAELRAFIAERVPAFMVPEQFVFLESVPSTGSGKVDREKLRQDGDPIERLQQPVAQVPRSETERAVASIWSELLGREPAAEDNFFAMGGHSLMAAQVVARIQVRLGVRLELRQMFERPTVASLACAVEEMRSSHVPTPQAIPRAERQFVRPR